MPSTDDRRRARREEHAVQLEQLEDDVIIGVEEFFGSDKPAAVKKHVGGQLLDLVTNVSVHGHVEPAALLRRPIAALGSGSTPSESSPTTPRSDDEREALDLLKAITDHLGLSLKAAAQMAGSFLQPLVAEDDDQLRKVRLEAMLKIATGELAINRRSGDLEIKESLDAEKTAHGELKRRLSDIGTTVSASDPSDVGEVRDKVRELARGGITPIVVQLQRDLGVDNPGRIQPAVRDLKLARDSALAVIEDVKANLQPPRRLGGDNARTLAVKPLKKTSKDALGLS